MTSVSCVSCVSCDCRKEKESKRLVEDKKELESKFNDYRRSAGEKLSKIRSDYDMLERRHQKHLFDEQNKVSHMFVDICIYISKQTCEYILYIASVF